MRIHYGPVPDDPDFDPEKEGWRSIREPGPWLIQVLALPVAVVLLLVSVELLSLVFSSGFFMTQTIAGILPVWASFIILILIIPIHETIHTVIHPGRGSSSKTVIGIWLSRVLFYAHYEGVMSRNRFLLVFAAPYIILALLPVPIIALFGFFNWSPAAIWILTYTSIIAGVLASGDFIGFWLVLLQVPGSALVRNKNWKTYWKPKEPVGLR